MTIKRAVTFTFWCDDGRYCDSHRGGGVRAGKTIVTTNKTDAVRAVKRMGWSVTAGHVVQCPACWKRKRR